ncbi:ABC transporter substrate-binding protein [Teichococcus wenyumeiae]|nr:ABC transporter substrate-binding protein [Pseudoroseomonas wenyumeiae]
MLLGLALPAQAQWPRQVTDILGRRVTVQQAPRAVLLGESFQLLTLSLIHPDPVSLLVGMGGDLRQGDPQSYMAFLRKFPALAHVPELTSNVGQSFSVERALALAPDLVILSAWQAPLAETQQAVAFFEASGTPVIFIDLFQKPLTNTLPSIRLLGEVLDRREQAEAFVRFQEEHFDRIRQRVATQSGPAPSVLLNAFPGRWPCCWAAGDGGAGEFLKLVGAVNVATPVLNDSRGAQLPLEQVLAHQPDIYVGTGLFNSGDSTGLLLGTGADAAAARASLERVIRQTDLADLDAVRAGRAHGLWNFFAGTAINLVGVEALARWVWPNLFRDVDPGATLAEINRRFAAVPFEGTYWISLDPSEDGGGAKPANR